MGPRGTSTLFAQWRELGGLSRLAGAGLVVPGVMAVLAGVWLEDSVNGHLLDMRAEAIQGTVDDLAVDDFVAGQSASPPTQTSIDAAIGDRVVDGNITQVLIRDATGAVVYADPVSAASHPRAQAIETPHVERHPDGLLHYGLPITSVGGATAGTFEALEQAAPLRDELPRFRRNLWLSIATMVGTLGMAMAAFTLRHAHALDRRRRYAERLLREMVCVEDQERRRIVGYLHDDVGPPLYRVLYGLEGCRAGLPDDSDSAAELDRLAALVRDVDRTLRDELQHLHRSTLGPLDLASAIQAVAQDCRDESDLRVEVAIDPHREPSPAARSVLLRAVHEALTNVRRHASACTVRIRVRGDRGHTLVEVVDDGSGFQGSRGLGLTCASERLDAIGGRLSVQPGRDRGTVFRAWAPVASEVAS